MLLGAAAASLHVRPDAANVFGGRNDLDLNALLARILFGASGVAQFVAILRAFLSFRQAKLASILAFVAAGAWAALVAFWVHRSD